MNGGVLSLAVHDRGFGPELFAGGFFTQAGGVTAARIAAWDGKGWNEVGGGLDAAPSALASFYDGSGLALYATGGFSLAGGVPAQRIARFDGQAWGPLGAGLSGGLFGLGEALLVADLGEGPALYVGGSCDSADGVPAANLARFSNGTFEAVGGGLGEGVLSLALWPTEGGTQLMAGGVFRSAGERVAYGIARFDGSDWLPLSTGIGLPYTHGLAGALTVYDAGEGERLYVGGRIETAGGFESSLMPRFADGDWDPNPDALVGWEVSTLVRVPGPDRERLYVGGSFSQAGDQPAKGIARWDGNQWETFGGGLEGLGYVRAMVYFDSGQGAELYAAGSFAGQTGVLIRSIARWDGQAWLPLGLGLYGSKTIPPSGGPFGYDARALAVFEEGQGERLFAGGGFNYAGTQLVSNVARWDGSVWSDVGGGVDRVVDASTVFDDGGGPALYAGGAFSWAGGLPARGVARWDGFTWSAVGSLERDVTTFAKVDLGAGTRLLAGGLRPFLQGVPEQGSLELWSGGEWVRLTAWDGLRANAIQPLGVGGALPWVVAGNFQTSPAGDSLVALWGCPSAGSFTAIPGCTGQGAGLIAISGKAASGAAFELELAHASWSPRLGVLFLGVPGFDTLGCGPVLLGLGEMLLAPAPMPLPIAMGPSTLGVTRFGVSVPSDPRCVGSYLALQGVHLAVNEPGSPAFASEALATVVSP